MKAILQDYVNYNLWANERIAILLKAQPESFHLSEIENSFPGIKATLVHINGAQEIWYRRLQGDFPKSFPVPETPTTGILDHILSSSKGFVELVEQSTEEDLAADCTYLTMGGDSHQQKRWEIIMHCINHSTYHRGQLVTMSRQLGLRAFKPTDYIWYLREKDQG